MISRHHQALSGVAESRNRFTVLWGEAIALINGEQPELIEIAAIKSR
jgi:hypothetical protein